MLIRVYWVDYMDLIEVPEFVAYNIQTYVNRFDEWLPSSSYLGEMGYEFDIQAFIDFLNDTVLNNEINKACVVRSNFIPTNEEKEKYKKYPKIYF